MSDSSHSYAWTSVVIPGPQHTVQQKYNNKATFTLNQLEIQVDYQVSPSSLQSCQQTAIFHYLRSRSRPRTPSGGEKSRNNSLSELMRQVREEERGGEGESSSFMSDHTSIFQRPCQWRASGKNTRSS